MHLIFDFDSTIVTIEGLDTLAYHALSAHPQRDTLLQQIHDITTMGMDGNIPFDQALQRRIALLDTDKEAIDKTEKSILACISPSFSKHKQFLYDHRDQIYVVSGGFEEFIFPVVEALGLKKEHVFANRFIMNNESVVSIDYDRLLSHHQGKVHAIKALALGNPTIVIGDGYTDYEIKKEGYADTFIAYTETIHRDSVVAFADHIAESLDDVIDFLRQEKKTLG